MSGLHFRRQCETLITMIRQHPLTEFRKTQAPRLGLREAARIVGSSASVLSRIEAGKIDPPLRLAIRLAEYTGLPIEVFQRPEKRS
jgi:DNA-binding XRE family transcriptional regulator